MVCWSCCLQRRAERTPRAAGSLEKLSWGWSMLGGTGLSLSWASPFSGSSQISLGFQSCSGEFCSACLKKYRKG